ncbi:hypothetical protein [Laceyella putida]|jgi:hypothetical protein|uniref:Gamma-glutamylcyclotransferase n=2 Tax=Laceyella putida TaxID=110101 RepID=A0ABW2RK24_9BACL
MKSFTHGMLFNFQEAAREMFARDITRKVGDYLAEHPQSLFGTIDLGSGSIYVYGHLRQASFDEEADRCEFAYHSIEGDRGTETLSYEELLISHEAGFDIVEDEGAPCYYDVLYVTFMDEATGKETTYFIADEQRVAQPLAYVGEYWQRVSEVGRDVDFQMSGCSKIDPTKGASCCEN